jgi:hypothetical protein
MFTHGWSRTHNEGETKEEKDDDKHFLSCLFLRYDSYDISNFLVASPRGRFFLKVNDQPLRLPVCLCLFVPDTRQLDVDGMLYGVWIMNTTISGLSVVVAAWTFYLALLKKRIYVYLSIYLSI